ncbi:MAG: histidine phosphatase family protein [Deltaproteobacteria bacterium]|nr:histidine phosphatase family protein [Deltaproteobacteria bacterium]
MGGTVFLLRSGDTPWHHQGRLLGRRDIGLAPEGQAQVQTSQAILGDVVFSELLCSPLASAIETAEAFTSAGLSIGRDPRLNNIDLGPWEGAHVKDLAPSDPLFRLLAGDDVTVDEVEELETIRHRVVSSIEQSLDDNPPDSNIILVSHAVPIRLALTHYLGIQATLYPRFHVAPASFCILQRRGPVDSAHVLAINWTTSVTTLLTSPSNTVA